MFEINDDMVVAVAYQLFPGVVSEILGQIKEINIEEDRIVIGPLDETVSKAIKDARTYTEFDTQIKLSDVKRVITICK